MSRASLQSTKPYWPGLRRPHRASTLLTAAFVLALVPLVLLSTVGIARWVAAQKSDELHTVSRYAETLARTLERELGAYAQAVDFIAGSQFLQRGDFATMEQIARDMAARLGGRIVILDPSGQQLLNTQLSPGAPLPKATNTAAIQEAFKARRTTVIGFTTSVGKQQYLFGAFAPVFVDGAERYVVTYIPPEGSLKKLLDDLVLPSGWFASLIDANKRIVARSHDHEKFYGTSAGQEFLRRLSGDAGLMDSVDLQGRASFTAYSSAGDWRAVVWVPQEIVNAPGNTALGMMAAALAATLLVSAALARVFGRFIREPVAQLVRGAEALGNGSEVATIVTPMKEANLVGAALQDAAQRITTREAQIAETAEHIRESEQRYRELIEGLRDAVAWEGDPDTLRFTFVSDAAEAFLGYPAQQWLDDPKFWASRVHEDDRDRVIPTRRNSSQAGRRYEFEYRLIARDGRTVWVRENIRTEVRGAKRVSRGLIVDISKAKAAEAVLRDSEQHFRQMTEDAPVMIWMSDAQGKCIHLNRQLRQFWNIENEDLASFDWAATMHPDDAAEVSGRVAEGVGHRHGIVTQGRYKNHAGEYRVLRTEATPRFSAAGEFEGMLGVNVDVTEALEATDRIRSNEERLRIAAEAAELGVFEWRIQEDIALFENERMYAIFGHQPSEGRLSKREFLQSYIHPGDRQRMEAQLLAGIEHATSMRIGFRIRRRSDGEWRWIECAGNFARGRHGVVDKLVGVVADVTERRRTEEETLRSNALLRAVSDSASDLIFVKDRDCRMLFVNPATARIMGVIPDQLLGATGKEWARHPDEVEDYLRNDERIMKSGEAETLEETFTGVEGTRTYMSEKMPMKDAGGQVVGLIGVCRDITDRKEAEEQTKLLLQEVSHRAKNMLAVTQAIIRQTARERDPEKFADRVTSRLDGLAASHDLLVKSEWRSVDIRDLVEAQLSHCKELIGHRVHIAGPRFRLHPQTLQTIGMAIHELSTNASKYGALSGESGSVSIQWRLVRSGDGPMFEITWEEHGGPAVTRPSRRGFGDDVVRRMIEHSLDADVSLDYAETGLRWVARIPSGAIIASEEPQIAAKEALGA